MNYNNTNPIKEIDVYFKEVSKQGKTLTRAEERELSKRIKEGDNEALNKLITSNLKFVVKIAKGFRSYGVPFTDLISEGNIGLMRAAKKFDGERDIKFTSYAVWWIKSAIQDCIKKYSTDLNIVDVAEYTYDSATEDDLGSCNEQAIVDMSMEDEIMNDYSRKEAVKSLIGTLQTREKDILLRYFGIGTREMTLEEIGKEEGLTNERVRQILDKSIMKLRTQALLSDEFEDFRGLY